MIALTWVLGIVAALGVAGTIAAAIIFPAVVVPVLQNLVSWLLRCKPCLYALAVAGLMAACWWHGHHQAVLECREAELAAVIRNQEFDLATAQNAKADADKRARDIEESANEQAKKDADYIATLKAKPACELDDDDIGGMPNDKSRPRFKIPSFRAR